MKRRNVFASGMLLPVLLGAGKSLAREVFRIGLTPVFLDDQVEFLKRLRAYLEQALGVPVQFVRVSQRLR
jgi:phosphonate transport system substrate-binding protein